MKKSPAIIARLGLVLAVSFCPLAHGAKQRFDLVIRGGRVIDPQSGLDAVRNVGIRGKRIASVTEAPIDGASVLDARGLVVAPGLIERKGRVQAEADADLVVFDPATVADRAVFGDFDQPSLGFVHVLVDGLPVVRDSRLVDGAFPGQPVRGNGAR